ncbi:MAG: Deoxyguanosinetriphosphate triphosphohydrolase [Syntrophus sp. PtaB.Bin001]|nr:MAG: Deoxyguanosinetriphosphate triphosphohydrolase [Syntrophus sp. PtaB.Bin001]
MTAREFIEASEEQRLAPYATKSADSIGRTLYGNEPDDYRTCFQRDRDRILYSKVFKDLQHKTQVFLINEGDFYRTRLTHTLEVAQHARTFARALRLNEDLCEAIAYAHDLGHPPFGHAGEEALDELLKDDGGFEHNIQSLRVVDFLEKRYQRYDGLNLCFETREGIARHNTTHDHPDTPAEFMRFPRSSLEAQIVNIADPLAYCAHDLEDALNAGYLRLRDLRDMGNSLVKRVFESCSRKYPDFLKADTVLQSRILVRTLIEEANIAVIRQTSKNIERYGISSVEEARKLPEDIVAAPAGIWENFEVLKAYLFENVYRKPQVCIMNEKGKLIIRQIFRHLEKRPEMLPRTFKARFDESADSSGKRRVLADYISGMTDRYVMDLHMMMFEPYEKVMFEFRE